MNPGSVVGCPISMQPPLMVDITVRKRLFQLIDSARRRHCVWLTASAGFGKTTTLASYVNQQEHPFIWFALNKEDSDPIRFFQRLTAALTERSPELEIPEISIINLADPESFGQVFFTALKESGIIIVLDDYHHISPQSPLHNMLLPGLELLGAGSWLIASREPPPSQFVRPLANSVIECLAADTLKFSLDETENLLQQRGLNTLSRQEKEQLQEVSEGWAAGLVLLISQKQIGNLSNTSEGLVFNYFLTEILSKLDPENRGFLLQVALLPEVRPDLAMSLTAIDNATEILETLSRSISFIQKIDGAPPVYRFHALFREVLLALGQAEINNEALTALKQKTASLLSTDGQLDAAVEILVELQDWKNLIGLICSNAESQLSQGRHLTLKSWLQLIPPPVSEQVTWLSFWDCLCDLGFQPAESRTRLETVLERFKQENDSAGIYLTWSFIVESYWMERNDTRPLADWLVKVESLMDRYPIPEDPMVHARLTYGRYLAQTIGPETSSYHPDIEERVVNLLRSPMPAEQKVAQASYMMLPVAWIRGDKKCADEIRNLILPLLEKENISPMTRFMWGIGNFMYLYHFSRQPLSETESIFATGKLGQKHGFKSFWPNFQAINIYMFLTEGKLDKAEEMATAMGNDLTSRPETCIWDKGHHSSLSAAVNYDKGHHNTAIKLAEIALEAAPTTHTHAVTLSEHQISKALFELDRVPEALQHLGDGRRTAKNVKANTCLFYMDTSLAFYNFRLGRQQRGEKVLQHALRFGKENELSRCLFQSHKEMSWLCATALNADIEPEYTKILIRASLLTPPEDLICKNWPWPVKIQALGSLKITVNDNPLSFEGKTQAKPLEMLRELIIHNGAPVSVETMADALWPESNNAQGKASLKTTLQRLRKLLGHEAILQAEGKININHEYCWLDFKAFGKMMSADFPETDKISLFKLENILNSYRGSLLQDSSLTDGEMPLREKLQNLYLKGILQVSKLHFIHDQPEQALGWLVKGLESVPSSETLYQELIRCYLELGRKADAVHTYKKYYTQVVLPLEIEPSNIILQLMEAAELANLNSG